MSDLQPVDGDPFAGAQLQPVNGDPFASTAGGPMTDADYARGSQIGSELASTWPVRTAEGIWSGITAPGDVIQGKLDLNSPEAPGRVFNAATMAMTGGLLAAPEADAAGSVLGSGPIVAYHGSPHDFDAFDMSKIGTGEGVQAYGHGLYFAGNEGVANQYKTALSKQVSPIWKDANGQTVNIDALAKSTKGDPQSLAASFLQQEPDVDSALAFAQKLHPDALGGQSTKDATIQGLQAFKDAGLAQHRPGSMYQVQINADPNHFLDWDKPLSEQHPVVQEALGKLGAGSASSGKDAWETVAYPPNVSGNPHPDMGYEPEQAIQTLRQAGIPGIKYLDAGSRGTGTGTSNYVVFDDKTIQILKKYGIGGLGIGTAAALKHFQTQPVVGDPYSNQNPGGVI